MFTPDQLRAWSVDHPPPRAVRKTLFTLRLWRPACDRRPVAAAAAAAAPGRNVGQPRSADSSMSVAWLNTQSLRNKTGVVCEIIADKGLDVLALTETWHSGNDDACLRLATPPGYAVVDVARTSTRGGGVAIIFRKHLKCSRLTVPACRTLEVICVRLTTLSGPVIVMNIYRPGSEKPSALFFDELASVLETLVSYSCPIVVGGDFNVRSQDPSDPDARRLDSLLASFDLVQHSRGPTHRCGNTLDLVLTFADRVPDTVRRSVRCRVRSRASYLPPAVAPRLTVSR